jgi:hypothetical protein
MHKAFCIFLSSFTRLEDRPWNAGWMSAWSQHITIYNELSYIHSSLFGVPNCAGPMDNYYAEALRDYAAVNYEALHSYLIEGLRYWYELFPPSQEGGVGRCRRSRCTG